MFMFVNRYRYPGQFTHNPLYTYRPQDYLYNANVSLVSKINEYIARALYYIDYIIRMIQSSSPYIEKVQPYLEDLPTMYQLMKAFQQINKADEAETPSTYDHPKNMPKPTLFI